jgi:Mn2+/Fe2+ NRAMP family transporter
MKLIDFPSSTERSIGFSSPAGATDCMTAESDGENSGNYSKTVEFAVAAAVFVVCAMFFGLSRALLLTMATGVVFIVTTEKWHLASRPWFIVLMASVWISHVSAIMLFDVPSHIQGAALLVPIMVVEAIALFLLVSAIEKRTEKPHADD